MSSINKTREVSDKEVTKILGVLGTSVNRNGYWTRTCRKLKELIEKEYITDKTQEQYEGIVADLLKVIDERENVISKLELIEKLQIYKKCEFKKKYEDQEKVLRELSGVLSEDPFVFGKSVSQMIEDIDKRVKEVTKAKEEERVAKFEDFFHKKIDLLNDELMNNVVKRKWADTTLQPLLKKCEKENMVLTKEELEVIQKLENIKKLKSSEEEKTDYDKQIDKWNAAEIRINK
ncbi:hypothetical protein EIN_229550 [Entamoeba invadens IP1]|uniref:Uncharacterized protein n=1 Tax=Entamoeba invadens IP1 TaxID=370355 RepID=A0A0A1U2Z6_ENTIV|nr:hypothetical protein EIN_229550 [Entamoeba invadens IP1]ELP88422.1 hypothetical protein EIN_229550 [Entamoeba invadens IP1]|eukprot:XP_004255193.1 hypothetical protein EIN_229550 [Entamoeba invadens IP1]